MKLRVLHEAEWGWKQRGLPGPKSRKELTGMDSQKEIAHREAAQIRAEKAAIARAKSKRLAQSSVETLAPDDPNYSLDDDSDVSDRLLAQQAKNKKARIAKSRRTPKPLVQFPED